MQYRLGLDVGTSSVGLVALELDEKGRAVKPVWHSVRIFDEPLLPAKQGGVGELKKADRRLARQQRRLHQRRARRLKHIAHLARGLGLDPATITADEGQSIHDLCARAATSPIDLPDLIRVLLKMGKRRGYSGGFKVKKVKKDDDKGQVETGIRNLKAKMQQHDYETLGEYLRYRIENGRHLRLKDDGLFADRQMVEEEFDRIWKTQEKYHPVLKEDYKGKPLRAHFYEAIFQQRPLKSPAAMVGNCSLEPTLPRAPMAQPIMQTFRIEKQIADLRWGTGRHARPLCPKQRAVIRERLRSQREVKFTTLYKALEKGGCPGPKGRELNLTHGDRESLTGDCTAAAMKSLGLLERWHGLEEGRRVSVINLLADMGSPDVFDSPEWGVKLKGAKAKKKPRQIKPEVKAFIDAMVETGKFDRLAKMKFDGGRSSYSIKALKKLVPVMEEDGVDEHEAISRAYPDSNPTDPKQLETELLPHKPTGNAVVDVALGQVGREVNAAIAALGGTPSEIVIELSRDMKTGLTKRDEITKKIRKNEKRRRDAADKIRKYTEKEATESQIKRYLLWQEQGERYCPYCEVPINCSDAINGGVTEYEHILPKSLTRIGRKRDFLVLAHKKCNQEKKDMTPWEAWREKDKQRWVIVRRRAKQFEDGYKVNIDEKERTFKHKGKARQLLVKDFEKGALDEAIIGDFSDRQFQETAWIAKACGKWFRSICPNVSVSRGLLTAHLRRIWKLDTVIPEVRYEENLPVFDEDYQPNKNESAQQEHKISAQDFKKHRPYWEGHSDDPNVRTHRRLNKRIDHRHHLVDALVIALTTRGLYQHMARHYQQVTESGRRALRLPAEPELANLREQALELVRKCRPSHRPDRWLAGKMFKENPYEIREDNGTPFYIQRTPVENLAKSREASVGDVRKSIEKILPESIRKIVSREFEARIKKGETPKQALAEPIRHPDYETCIRRVRLRHTKAGNAVRVAHGNRQTDLYKYLEPEGYAYLEFDRSGSNFNPRLVPLHEAMNSEGEHRSQSGVVRLYKKDTVHDSRDEKYYVVQQIKAEGPTLILSPITESIANVGNVQKPRARKVGGAQIKRLVPIEDERPSDSAG